MKIPFLSVSLEQLLKVKILACVLTALQAQPPFLAFLDEALHQMKTLTLEQKIGQLLIPFHKPDTPLEQTLPLIREQQVGGIIFLGISTPQEQLTLTHLFQSIARASGQLPLLVAQDAEWGLAMRLKEEPDKVVEYPRNKTLGDINNERLVYDLGKEIGQQCAAMGVHMNLAPVMDVNNNPDNPIIGVRSFGNDAQKVARLGCAYINGLQEAGVLACAKHFPGHGDTSVDSHHDLPVIMHDKNRLENLELVPFQAAIDGGVSCVMSAHLLVPAYDDQKPTSLSPAVVAEKLKKDLRFKGLTVTDALDMKAITRDRQPGDAVCEAFLAGNDLLLCPLDVKHAKAALQKTVEERSLHSELDARVQKIIAAKLWVQKQQEQYQEINSLAFIVRPEAQQLKHLLESGVAID